MSDHLPYGRQHVTGEDVEAVLSVLTSDWLTQGPMVPAFEAAVAERCGAIHAVAVNSATSALHIACLALGVGKGDWVWTTPITFVATANCARYCGAEVDFVDIDPGSYNMCPLALADKLARAKAGHQALPKVVIAVHFAGEPCDMVALGALADEFGFSLIEDASHAIGAWRDDERVGECRYSDIAIFSFHPVKIVTSAEGGVAVSASEELAERMRRARSHGVVRGGVKHEEEPWTYDQHTLGYNYRMNDLQAALGVSQLSRLDQYIAHRHRLAERYDACLADFDLILPARSPANRSSLHLYPVQVTQEPTDGTARRRVYHALRAADIGVNVHYIPVHTQPYYRARGHARDPLVNAVGYYERAVTLPLFGVMTLEEQDRVMEVLADTLHRTGRLAA